MSRIAVSVRKISKRYRKGVDQHGSLIAALRLGKGRDYFWALKDVSFEVEHGEMFGIVGSNGAGKSTLLKVLGRITRPNSGRAEMFGRVGSLLQAGTGFHPELTGRENIFLNGALLGMPRSEIKEKFDEIVDYSDVEEFLDTPIKRYSSGMKIRLGFAVAAHLDQEILLVDEVLAVGDAAFRDKCIRKMDEITHQGRTVIFVGHNMSVITTHCKRALWMDRGQVKAEGKAGEVVQTYLETTFSNRKQSSLTSFEAQSDADANGFRLTHTRLLNQKHEEVSALTTGERGVIALGFHATDRPRVEGAHVSLTILNQNHQPVAICDSSAVEESIDASGSRGEFLCEFEKLPLMPGFYRLNIECRIGSRVVCEMANAARFQVERGDFYLTGRLPPAGIGDCLIEHSWNTRDVDESTLAADGAVAADRHFAYGDLRIQVSSAYESHLVWLEEFLCPHFQLVAEKSCHAHVKLSVDPKHHEQLAKQGPAGGTENAFSLDSQMIQLPRWNDSSVELALFDESFNVFYLLRDSSDIEIVATSFDRKTRSPLMRVVRELAMNHGQDAGGLFVHGSAFAVGDRGVVLAGPKRSAKTTLLIHAMRHPGVSCIANDRVFVDLDSAPPMLRGMPTIVTIREPTVDLIPGLREPLVSGGYNFRMHRDELRAQGTTATKPWDNGKFGLSPAQFHDLMDVEPATQAKAHAIVFPSITRRPGRMKLQRVSKEVAADDLRSGLFAINQEKKSSDVFVPRTTNGRQSSSSDVETRVLQLTEQVPCYRCELGQETYESTTTAAELVSTLLSPQTS